MRVSGQEERMVTRFKFMQILHKLLIVNPQNSDHDFLFMLVENPSFTVYTHYIEIDEHSEMEVRNEVKSEGEGGVVTEQEEGLIKEITKRIREQIHFQFK
jgi:hypothetical protein